MSARQHDRHHPLRMQLAQAAARIMAEDGYSSFQQARQKAAQQLGVSNARLLPANQEIEQALIDYQQLFNSTQQHDLVAAKRRIACDAMLFLDTFSPRLTGSVLKGTAGLYKPVVLHLFCDNPDEVAMFLQDSHIPYSTDERKHRLSGGREQSFPLFRFIAEETEIELVVFPLSNLRQPPLSQVDQQPVKRACRDQVLALLDSDTMHER